MRRRLVLLLVLAALSLFGAGSAFADRPPPFVARSVVVADGKTGEILYARRPNLRLPVASITKIMTALVTLEHARPSEVVTVQGSAPTVGESTINLRVGERLRVRELLTAALVQSANDAAYALALHVGGGSVRRFVRLMNERARELGLRNTHYVRPDGLDVPGHYSSARDSLTLARAAMKNSLFRKIVRTRGGEIAGGRKLYVWNDLLRTFPGTIGVKTGHTALAGWSQVAAARRAGVTVYTVLLGGPSRGQRNADLAELLEWGLDHYRRVTLVQPRRAYATAALPFSGERLPLLAAREAEAIVRVGRPLVEKIVAPAMVELPLERGVKVGEILVYDGDRVVARRALVAAETVGEPGLVQRIEWYAGRAVDEARGMLETVLSALG